MFDKKTGKEAKAAIDKIACTRSFYDAEDEKRLNIEVEMLGGDAIQTLLKHKVLSVEERVALSLHVATMIKRVPHRREKVRRMIPQMIEGLRGRNRPALLKSIAVSRGFAVAEEELSLLDKMLAGLHADPPPELENLIRSPWASEAIVKAVYGMTWRILEPPPFTYFITTDNPTVFFEEMGLEQKGCELVFPLSTDRVLHGSHQTSLSNLSFLRVQESIVREINRRMAQAATRFAFYHDKAEWIVRLMQRKKPRQLLKFQDWALLSNQRQQN